MSQGAGTRMSKKQFRVLQRGEEKCLTSMRKAGAMVSGILQRTMRRTTRRELPGKTGVRIRVAKYMTGIVSYAPFEHETSPGEIQQICWDSCVTTTTSTDDQRGHS